MMMKKLLLLAILKKLLMAAVWLVWSSWGAQALTTQEFLRLYPNATQEGNCYLTRLDDCNVTAVINDAPAEHEIALIFVQNKQKQKSMEVANRIAQILRDSEPEDFGQQSEVGGYDVASFSGTGTSAVIFCPISVLPARSPLSVLLSPLETSRETTQFLNWQGRSIRARVSQKGGKSVIEMTVNLEESGISSAEFRVVKGKMSEKEMQKFIFSRMGISAVTTNLSTKARKDLRELYANHDIVSYSSSDNFCIVSKMKSYRFGTPDGVKEATRNLRRTADAFPYPKQNHAWPEAGTALAGTGSPATPTEQPTATAAAQPAAVDAAGDQALNVQVIPFAATWKQDSAPNFLHKNDEKVEPALTPEQAYKQYQDRLRNL